MKSFVLFILITTMFICCDESEKLRIVNFADENYFAEEVVDQKANIDYLFSKVNWNKIEELYDKTEPNSKKFLAYIFVGEKGNVDKIVIAKSLGKTVDNHIVDQIKEWKISPAIKDGKNVKSILEWFFIKDESGIVFNESTMKNYLPPPPPPPQIDESDYFVELDEYPVPIGGIKEIQKKIVYPDLAKKTGTEGKVLVKTLINEIGEVVATEIVKGIGSGCDEAAMNAVRVTAFTPGKKNGINVKVQVIIPIMFKLR